MTSEPDEEYASYYDLMSLPNGQLLTIHGRRDCTGDCAFHNPMPGEYQKLPMSWRDDRKLLERICSHGVGHPDPNQFAFWAERGQEGRVMHGCCWEFCCTGWYPNDW